MTIKTVVVEVVYIIFFILPVRKMLAFNQM